MTIAATTIDGLLNRPLGAGFAPAFEFPVVDPAAGIPLSFDDPMFGGMVESAAPITLIANQRLLHQSIQETGPDPTIACVGGNVLSYCRVLSRHCVDSGGGDLSIMSCYLEATGQAGDTSDTVAINSPGVRDETITLEDTMIVGHPDNAQAGFYAGGNWGGTIVLDGVIFQGGPYGLLLSAEAGCHIDIYLNNVFFVGAFGTAPYAFDDVDDGTHTIMQWQNVRSAAIVGGVLVPGDPIAQPASSALRLMGSDGSLLLGSDGNFLLAKE